MAINRMQTNAFTVDNSPKIDRSQVMLAAPGAKSGASWFYWIAGLSLVNTILIHSGSDTSFVVGLGFTLLVDYFLRGYMAIALIADVFAIGCFVGIGYAAYKGHGWAFILGAVLYLCDAGIYLVTESWMSVAFHAYALFCIVRGYLAYRSAYKDAEIELQRAANTPPPIPSLVSEPLPSPTEQP